MTKFSDLKFTPADFVKGIAGVLAFAGLYYGIWTKIDETNAKIDVFIATQKGVNDVLNLRLQQLEGAAAAQPVEYLPGALVAREGIKPKPIAIEVE